MLIYDSRVSRLTGKGFPGNIQHFVSIMKCIVKVFVLKNVGCCISVFGEIILFSNLIAYLAGHPKPS